MNKPTFTKKNKFRFQNGLAYRAVPSVDDKSCKGCDLTSFTCGLDGSCLSINREDDKNISWALLRNKNNDKSNMG